MTFGNPWFPIRLSGMVSLARGRIVDDSSVEFFPARGIAGLDVEEINVISLLIRKFIRDQLGAEFVALAEANFKTVRYFPISALGCSPQLVGEHLMVWPRQY